MKGSALIAAFILIVIGSLIMGGFLIYVSHESRMTKRMNDSIKALYIAEAGLERKLYEILNEDDSDISDPAYFPDSENINNFYEVSVVTDGSGYIVTSTGEYYSGKRIVQQNVELANIWGGAIFGNGLTVQQIHGSTQVSGTVYVSGEEAFIDLDGDNIFDYTDVNGNGIYDVGDIAVDTIIDEPWGIADFRDHLSSSDWAINGSGNFGILNDYQQVGGGLPSMFNDRIPSLDTGETLEAELNVKYGMVNLDGSAQIGTGSVPLDLVNVPDRFTDGSISNVYTDKLLYSRSRFNEKLRFPNLADVVDGVTRLASLETSGYVYTGDISITPASATDISFGGGTDTFAKVGDDITINGIIYINGNLTINRASGSLDTMYYDGNGSIVVTGNITIGTNLYTLDTNSDYTDGTSAYPENNVIGFMTPNNINLGEHPGASQPEMMAVFYAGGIINFIKQPLIAGALMCNELDLGGNNPNVFQVKELLNNLPPGMINIPPVLVIDSWHEVF